jgi:hypothetical protein
MDKTADQIGIETNSFPIGSRVRRNPDCIIFLRPNKRAQLGTVIGYRMGGCAQYGFNAISCLAIRWDGTKTTDSRHKDFVVAVTPLVEPAPSDVKTNTDRGQ